MIIPDGEMLFKYVRPDAFPEDQTEIPLGIFNIQDLSCDWMRYRENPHTSFHIEEGKTIVIAITSCDDIRNPKNPKRHGQVVPDWHQEIIHDPVSNEDDPVHGENLAHSLIRGPKKLPVQKAIRDNSKIY